MNELQLFLQEKRNSGISLIPSLYKASEVYGKLTVDVLREVADGLHLPLSRVVAAATFYSAFNGMDDGSVDDRFLEIYADGIHPTWFAGHPAGYVAARRVLDEKINMVDLLRQAKLRGRSGSGFPLADKWELTARTESDAKYIVCNGSEGEGDTYKDYFILTKKPELMIEGMLICALTTNISQGYLYVRAEYEKAFCSVQKAIRAAYDQGVLGDNAMGSGKTFHLEAVLGGGAYVSGEETGLLEMLEGRRSEPRLKPPFPGVSGLFGKPTIVNNAESFAATAVLALHGAEEFLAMGTEETGGTKLYTVTGCVRCPGVYELPHDAVVAEALKAAGGPAEGCVIKGFQIGGGATGSFGGRELLDVVLDYGPLRSAGLSLGTAAIRFIAQDESIPHLAYKSIAFLKDQSCGLCTACRYGLSDLTNGLSLLCGGQGTPETLAEIKSLCGHIGQTARCALGQAAPTALVTAMKAFPTEFEDLCGKEEPYEQYSL